MSGVVRVSKHWDNHSGSENQSGLRTRTETFLVTTTEPTDDPEVIRLAVDNFTGEAIPRRFDPWEGYVSGVVDNDLRVVAVTPRQTEDVLVWKVTVEYSTEARQDPDQVAEDWGLASSVFDDRSTSKEWQSQTDKRAIQWDVNGLALRNSVDQPFDPPPEEDVTVSIRRLVRNERDFDDAVITDYTGRVNSQTVRLGGKDRDPYTVWVREIRPRREFAGGNVEYHQVSYELHIKPLVYEGDPQNGIAVDGGWYTRLLDAGYQKFRRVNPANPYSAVETGPLGEPLLEHIKDPVYGERLAQPALLDGAGQELRFAFTYLGLACNALDVVLAVDSTDPIVTVEPPLFLQIDNEVVLLTSAALSVKDTQTISMGVVTAGTFTLTLLGLTTAAIAWNATARAVQDALVQLSEPIAASVECSGGPLPGTPVVVKFSGILTGAQALMTHADTLTGGVVTITHTTTGATGFITVVRGARGTARAAHAIDAKVQLRPIAFIFSNKRTADLRKLNLE